MSLVGHLCTGLPSPPRSRSKHTMCVMCTCYLRRSDEAARSLHAHAQMCEGVCQAYARLHKSRAHQRLVSDANLGPCRDNILFSLVVVTALRLCEAAVCVKAARVGAAADLLSKGGQWRQNPDLEPDSTASKSVLFSTCTDAWCVCVCVCLFVACVCGYMWCASICSKMVVDTGQAQQAGMA
jgi:hypothetical protein